MSEETLASSRLVAARAAEGQSLSLSTWSWIGYEVGRVPYVVLIKIYIFTPYVTKVLIGDPVMAQALLAGFAVAAGVIAALTVPFLGAALDRMGPRKPWIAVFVLLEIPLLISLWWAKPDRSGLSATAVISILALLGLLFAYAEILHNAMLGPSVGIRRAGRYSGISLGVANLFTVAIMIFLLWGFALPGKLHGLGVPDQPLFGLSRADHDMERLLGPFIAVVVFVGLTGLLRFAIDAAPTRETLGTAVRSGLRDVLVLIRSLPQQRNILKFLIARTVYGDGLYTLIKLEGIYASGVMGWHALDLLAFAVVKIIFASLGGLLAGILNTRMGTRRALILELCCTILLLVMVLGTTPTRLLYFWQYDLAAHAPLWSGPVFRSWPEVAFLLISSSMTAFAVATTASGRAMVVEIVPPERLGSFLGLFHVTASTTAWMAPAMIGVFTAYFHSQSLGLIPVAVLLGIGTIGLLFVEGGDRHGAKQRSGIGRA
ncbi:MFS transporter [Bradyrhizobium sp. CCBAU 51753]|uniref:MFS transporter n=1 Tax=Bradyrhizobium sp. CCBAU 51753 TaxID=1325100 RepID=UPI00188BEE3E|nr:MFS transporter [Bradyrhizobium sp. CCBAU 51753]